MFKEEFNAKIDPDERRLSAKYIGRQITWYGDRDQMIVIPVDNVEGMWGNIYYPEKLEQLIELIKNSDENIELGCSYAVGSIVNLNDIIEEQQSEHNDNFSVDYEQLERPKSTGDSELDNYVGHEELQEYPAFEYVDGNVLELMEKLRFGVARGQISPDKLKAIQQELDAEEDELEAFAEFVALELELANAVINNTGDLGKFTVQLRDGHHRFQAAKAVGEDKIAVNLAKDDLNNFKGRYTLVTNL